MDEVVRTSMWVAVRSNTAEVHPYMIPHKIAHLKNIIPHYLANCYLLSVSFVSE